MHKSAQIGCYFPDRENKVYRMNREIGAEYARLFGSRIRTRRKAMNLRLDDLATASGVGRRFLHELETGKPICQLGRALAVAAAVGMQPADLLVEDLSDECDLPPLTPRGQNDA